MKLIKEISDTNLEPIMESYNGSKSLYLTGTFLQGVIKNRNGRIYPMHILESAVNSYSEKFITSKRSYGELNHPPTPVVNLERVCILTESLEKEGNNYIGKAKVLTETPLGHTLKGIIDGGGKVAVSSRGLGTLTKSSQGNLVNEGFFFTTTADVVGDPSAPDALVEAIMENVEWIVKDGKYTAAHLEQIEEQRNTFKRIPKSQQEAAKLRIFESFLGTLTAHK